MSFSKIIEVNEMLKSRRLLVLEPSVQLITPGTSSGLSEKIASEASEWARSVESVPGKTYILVLALGASEYYGPNRNGDGFKESELKKSHETFKTNAHVYRSHVNKDPKKSFGKVVKSFYNDNMHRVELVLEIDDVKAPDVADKIKNRETVAVSMGCRIKFDVCSICGNKAPNRKEYCEHAKYQLNDIYPDGRIVFVDNPNPVFFDISVVWRPADRTGYMLKKVAYNATSEKGEASALLAEKTAGMTVLSSLLRKAADIEKTVSGVGFGKQESEGRELSGKDALTKKWLKHVVPKIISEYQPVSNDDLGWLSGKQFPRVLASLSSMGIFLTTPEFLDVFFQMATGKPAPAGAAQKLIELQGSLFRFMSESPEIAYQMLETKIVDLDADKDPEIVEKMSKYSPKRSLHPQAIQDRIYKAAALSGTMQTLSYTDPKTGRTYTTNAAIARSAGQREDFDSAVKLLGSSALAAVVYRILAPALGKKALVPSLGLLGLGASTLPDSKEIMTDQGVAVPTSTEFTERTASAEILSTILAADRQYMEKVAHPAKGRVNPTISWRTLRDLEQAVSCIGKALLN